MYALGEPIDLNLSATDDNVCARCSSSKDEDCKCMCSSPFPYRRLDDEEHERPVKILFYKYKESEEDKVYINVERGMHVFDLCKLVAATMGYNSTSYWSLVEYWIDKKARRVLEEHEVMVDVYYEMIKFKRKANVRYVLEQDISKFDYLKDPIRIRNEGGVICEDKTFFDDYHELCYIESVVDQGRCPVFFSRAGVRIDNRDVGCFLLLRNQRLFYTGDLHGTQRLLQLGEMFIRKHYYKDGPIHIPDIPGIILIGKITDLQVYRVQRHKPDEQDHILLRPAATPVLRNTPKGSEEPADRNITLPSVPKSIIRIIGLSDNFASTWIALMRLAKYGKQLRENYRAFGNRNDTSTREFTRANVPNQPGKEESPLFRRKGCEYHLGRSAQYRKKSHENKFIVDLSHLRYPAGSGRAMWESKRLSQTIDDFLHAVQRIPRDSSEGGFMTSVKRKFSKDLRRRPSFLPFRRGRKPPPKKPPSYSSSEEHQPVIELIPSPQSKKEEDINYAMLDFSTKKEEDINYAMLDFSTGQAEKTAASGPSTQRMETSVIEEKKKRFGAIRKIFKQKKKKSGKKAQEGLPLTPVHYKELQSDDPSPHEETPLVSITPGSQSETAALLPIRRPEAGVHLPSADAGATALGYFPVSAVEQSVAARPSTSEAGNEPPILERVDRSTKPKPKPKPTPQLIYDADEHEEDYPNFALIKDGEFIKDYYPEHQRKRKE